MQRLRLGKTLLPTGKQNTSLCVCVLALCLLQVKLQSFSHCLYHCAQAFWTWLATFVAAVVGVAFFSCLCKTEFWLVLATHFACHNFQWEKRSRHTHTHMGHTHIYSLLRTHLLTPRCQLWRARCVARICSAKATAARTALAAASTADIAYAAAVCGNGKAADAFSCRTESWESNCECNIC